MRFEINPLYLHCLRNILSHFSVILQVSFFQSTEKLLNDELKVIEEKSINAIYPKKTIRKLIQRATGGINLIQPAQKSLECTLPIPFINGLSLTIKRGN